MMEVWKMIFHCKWVIFRFQPFIFLGGIQFSKFEYIGDHLLPNVVRFSAKVKQCGKLLCLFWNPPKKTLENMGFFWDNPSDHGRRPTHDSNTVPSWLNR